MKRSDVGVAYPGRYVLERNVWVSHQIHGVLLAELVDDCSHGQPLYGQLSAQGAGRQAESPGEDTRRVSGEDVALSFEDGASPHAIRRSSVGSFGRS